MPRYSKWVIEADRGTAAMEHGYRVRLMKLLHPASSVRNDLLVGCPSERPDPLADLLLPPRPPP